jgi:hypothetical protein
MMGEVVCATATFGIPEMVMFKMDALAAARETALADAASDDKYFPLRRVSSFATTMNAAENTTIYLLSCHCTLLLNSIAKISETGLLQTQRRPSLSPNSRVSIRPTSPFTPPPSLFSNDYTLYTCMAFLRTLTGAFMVKRHQIYDNTLQIVFLSHGLLGTQLLT